MWFLQRKKWFLSPAIRLVGGTFLFLLVKTTPVAEADLLQLLITQKLNGIDNQYITI